MPTQTALPNKNPGSNLRTPPSIIATIILVSAAASALICYLVYFHAPLDVTGAHLRSLPLLNAVLNALCTAALLIVLGQYFRAHPPQGYSIWLLFDDGEEAVANPPYDPSQWASNNSNNLYGTRHLAAKWYTDGTLNRIKAFILADMIGDKDLNILEEDNSTAWLKDDLRQAAVMTHHTANVFKTKGAEDDDHLPFLKRGVPTIDIIDADYGPHDAAHPDGYHHTPEDTIDKISPQSLQISADLFLETIRLIDER